RVSGDDPRLRFGLLVRGGQGYQGQRPCLVRSSWTMKNSGAKRCISIPLLRVQRQTERPAKGPTSILDSRLMKEMDGSRKVSERDAIRVAILGILVNGVLATAKLIGGIVGNAYVLVADAVESMTDIFSSFVV